MVSIPKSHVSPSPVTIHDASVMLGAPSEGTVDAAVTHIGLRSLRLHGVKGLRSAQMLWVDVDLGSAGSIRPLAEVVRREGDRVDVRLRHLFPDDKRRLEGYFRANATPSGY